MLTNLYRFFSALATTHYLCATDYVTAFTVMPTSKSYYLLCFFIIKLISADTFLKWMHFCPFISFFILIQVNVSSYSWKYLWLQSSAVVSFLYLVIWSFSFVPTWFLFFKVCPNEELSVVFSVLMCAVFWMASRDWAQLSYYALSSSKHSCNSLILIVGKQSTYTTCCSVNLFTKCIKTVLIFLKNLSFW